MPVFTFELRQDGGQRLVFSPRRDVHTHTHTYIYICICAHTHAQRPFPCRAYPLLVPRVLLPTPLIDFLWRLPSREDLRVAMNRVLYVPSAGPLCGSICGSRSFGSFAIVRFKKDRTFDDMICFLSVAGQLHMNIVSPFSLHHSIPLFASSIKQSQANTMQNQSTVGDVREGRFPSMQHSLRNLSETGCRGGALGDRALC